MSRLNSQKTEIQTIRPRNLFINLSDADCDRITQKAFSCGLNVSELLAAFIGDLIYGTYSNGSDERMYANEWFDRCGFSWNNENTFIKYLIEYGEIDNFIEIINDIERQQEYINALKASGADNDEISVETDILNAMKEDSAALYDLYAQSTDTPQSTETALNGVLAYRNSLLSLKGEKPRKMAHRPRTRNTADINAVCAAQKEYFTPEEAASLLNVHYNTVRRLIKRGELPAEKYGRQWRIAKQDLLNLNR